jgi:hypothetical protein
MPALSEENVPESDRPKITLDEFLRLKREIDARTSLTISQLYVIAFTAALLIFVLGLAGLYFLGFFWGAIFASVFSSLAVVSMASRMRNSNFRTNFGGRPELKKVARDEQIDDFIDS